MSEGDNLLTLLNKWTVQDENFVSDVFAHLLRHLLKTEPQAASSILRDLTGGLLTFSV
jgi:hypothetical protein